MPRADDAARVEGDVGEQVRALADLGVAADEAAGVDHGAGLDHGIRFDGHVRADVGRSGRSARRLVHHRARVDAGQRRDLVQRGEILRGAREIGVGVGGDDARAGRRWRRRWIVQRATDQRRRLALRGQRAQLAVAEEADVRNAGAVERRDPWTSRSGSPISWPPKRSTKSPSRVVIWPCLVVKRRREAGFVAAVFQNAYLSSSFRILSVMSMRGLVQADSCSTTSSFSCSATCSISLKAFCAIAARSSPCAGSGLR
jgi:hypothetical protein